MALGLSQYARLFLTDPDAMRDRIKEPVLLWASPNDPSADQLWLTTSAGQKKRPRQGEPLVFELKKASGKSNAFAMGVTVGRVENNDIVVEDGSVSRFHAYFQLDARQENWTLVDAESKNGTWVGALKLEPNAKVVVTNQARLRFGNVELLFLDPNGVMDLLKREVGG